MNKKIIIVGHAASGKDYLAKSFVDNGFKKDVSLTTRNPRVGEEEGFHYHYVNEDYFKSLVEKNKFYEVTNHNGWYYGTLRSSWEESDVFIMNIDGIKSISKEERENCIIVYLEIPENTRRERMYQRIGADDPERRIIVDRKMFKGFTDYDYRITNPFFDPNGWVSILSKDIVRINTI